MCVYMCKCVCTYVCVHVCTHAAAGTPLPGETPLWGSLPGTLQETGGVTPGWGHVPCHGTQPPECPWSPVPPPTFGSFRLPQNLSPPRRWLMEAGAKLAAAKSQRPSRG